MIRPILAALVLAAAFAASAMAADSTVAVTNSWARATPPGAKTAAAYVTLTNKGAAPDQLLSASTPVAGEAMLHITINDHGVMKMRPIKSIDLKPGKSVTFKPGGMHIMLMDLKQPLKEGDSFPLALTFAKAGRIETVVKVAKAGAMSGGSDMQGMDMK
jgi:periplasmic copper chaperone A